MTKVVVMATFTHYAIHSLQTWSSPAISPKAAQSLARHSSIDLTMNVYTSLTVNDQASALASLPSISIFVRPNAEASVLSATGTDGTVGTQKVPTVVPRGAEIGAIRLASEKYESAPNCTERDPTSDGTKSIGTVKNPEKKGVSCTTLHQSASVCKAEREGFEPSVSLRPHRFSRPARSATPAPLRQPLPPHFRS